MRDFEWTTIENKQIKVTFCNYGAMVYDLQTKDRSGQWESIILQYEDDAAIINNSLYLNAVVGPVAGRIANARYSIDKTDHSMVANHLQTESLHSGPECLSFVWFTRTQKTSNVVEYTYEKPRGSSQFPGDQTYRIRYELSNDALTVQFMADTTKDTLVNLTQHMYFNLSGDTKRSVHQHQLMIQAQKGLVLNDKFSPVAVMDVRETFLDFTQNHSLDYHLPPDVLSLPTRGIDHPLLLDEPGLQQPQAILSDPESGRFVSVSTTYPCMVVYTHNNPDHNPLKHLSSHPTQYGVCLEAQFEPNGINVEGLSSAILRKGTPYHHTTTFVFGLLDE